MARVTSNPFVSGLSGLLGNTLVFRNLRGKTIVASRPRPAKTQSESQRQNRDKFRQATRWAKTVLRDPKHKSYYQQHAKKLHLPNAYTAAITDYMRKPQLKTIARRDDTVRYVVQKQGFALQSAVLRRSPTDETPLRVNRHGAFVFIVREREPHPAWQVAVVDRAGVRYVLMRQVKGVGGDAEANGMESALGKKTDRSATQEIDFFVG